MNYVKSTINTMKGGVSVCPVGVLLFKDASHVKNLVQSPPGSWKSNYGNQIDPKTGSYTKYDCTNWDSVIKKRDKKF